MPRPSIYDQYRGTNGGDLTAVIDDDRDDELDKPKPAPRPKTETLSASVGDAGTNDRKDVTKVEKMLGATGDLDLKQTDGPTGYWGMRTSEATKRFQKKNKLKVDAQINPSGPTLKKLGEAVAAKLRQAQAQQRPKPARHPRVSGDQVETLDSRVRGSDKKAERNRPNLTPDAVSANARAARYLASRRGIGDYPTFVADGIEMNPEQGIAEAADLIEQTRAKSPKQADVLLQKTLDGLSDGNARSLIRALAEKDAPATDEPDTPPPDSGQDDPEEPTDPSPPDEPENPDEEKCADLETKIERARIDVDSIRKELDQEREQLIEDEKEFIRLQEEYHRSLLALEPHNRQENSGSRMRKFLRGFGYLGSFETTSRIRASEKRMEEADKHRTDTRDRMELRLQQLQEANAMLDKVYDAFDRACRQQR